MVSLIALKVDVRSLENSRDEIQSQIEDAKSSFVSLQEKEQELNQALQKQMFKKDLVRLGF
jgi:uncharacterized protein YlxW (UPF0749 family)